jgi:hypothetical protein
MVWYHEFNSTFWITLATILTGSIGLAIKYCLKSKCDNVGCCWGGLTIHRMVQMEEPEIEQEEMKESAMEMGNIELKNNVKI